MTNELTFDGYQLATSATAIYPADTEIAALSYVTLGLVGEAGEIANKVKKILRDGAGEVTPAIRKTLASEVGDVLWYLTRLADELGYSIEEIAADNLSKLLDRLNRDVLQGSGDNR